MKLKLIGTGAITGGSRSASSLIDSKILVDCGNGIVKTLTQQCIDIFNIEVILITHLHADHFFDLPFFVFLKSLHKPEKSTTIYCPKGTENIVAHLCNDYISTRPNVFEEWIKNGKVKFVEFESLDNVNVLEDYYVTSYVVDHGEKKPAYGYVVKKQDKAIGFSGDSSYCENIDKIVENSNVAVLDTTNVSDSHMKITDIEEICSKYNTKIVTTHMSEQARKALKEKNIGNLTVPEDGDEIIV